jgi:NADH:ubiquinone oxidoreductase subunit 2 (subunit N)
MRVLIIIRSRNWLILWISFELNTLIFLPLLKTKYYLFITEAIMKYFLLQSVCSITLILGWIIFKNRFFFIVILIVKIGLPPFHWWVIDFLKLNNWTSFFLLITIQKLGLLILISYFLNEKFYFLFFILFSIVLSLLNIWFLNNIFYLIIFSSIIHNSWLLVGIIFSIKLFVIYFLSYLILIILLIIIFKNNNLILFNQNINSWKLMLCWILIGLPPFSIFIIKWRISIFIIKWRISIFIIILITSFLIVYIYIKFIYLCFLIKVSSFVVSSFVVSSFVVSSFELIVFYLTFII